MKLSIIIITKDREKELLDCLQSLFLFPPKFSSEIVIVFNGPSSYKESIHSRSSSSKYPTKILQLDMHLTPGEARNLATQKAEGEYLLFLDDDCTIPENYFSQIFLHQSWDVLGGPDQSPPRSPTWQRNLGLALTSPLCMGPTKKRHSRYKNYNLKASEEDLILCNLVFKRSLFLEPHHFKFNSLLFRNEENHLLKELSSCNFEIHYNPNLYVFHQRKSNWSRLLKAMKSSGYHRAISFYLKPALHDFIYLGPILFWAFLILSLVTMPILFLAVITGYILAIIFYFLLVHKVINIQIIATHFFITCFYSLGLLSGFCRLDLIFKKKLSN